MPSYAKYTFIEPMVLPEGSASAIVELGIDQFTKPVTADSEKTVTNLATSLTLNAMGTSSVNSLLQMILLQEKIQTLINCRSDGKEGVRLQGAIGL